MSDDAQYSSGGDSGSHKRKYEEHTTAHPPPRRPTGFSAPIIAPSTDSAADEIQLAKQRAQEIAARLFNNASAGAVAAPPLESKRQRYDNGGGYDSGDSKGFSSGPSDKSHGSSSIPVSYGFQGSSKKIDVPNGRVGVIIGKGGETIKYLQLQSGAKIQVTRDMDADLNSATRIVELMGTPEQISKAEQLINDVLAGAETGGQGGGSRRVGGQAGGEQFVMKIPNNKVGLVIGKGGETIKNMQARTGARIQVIPLHLPPGDPSNERTLQIDGTTDQIENAKQLVFEVISENRPRNPSMSSGGGGGGYGQQGYQARPPSNWGPPSGQQQQQQPGYGYGQPGAYSAPQYNAQGSYPGYPQQSWDQSQAPPPQQAAAGYDYYAQQQQQPQNPGAPAAAAATDNAGYGYAQPPQASGYQNQQGYSQDGYGGYHQAYDQQQQGYSAQAYGAADPQATDSSQPTAATTGYGAAPTSQPGYGPGYGAPPPQAQAQKPSPTAPGGSYGHSQAAPPASSYAQPESSSQRGYGAAAAQGGYGGPAPYGGPPAGYGQGQQYGGGAAYGSGYAQPPPQYSADGGAAAAPPSQQSGGAVKASPQS